MQSGFMQQPAPQGNTPTFPGVWANTMYGQQGGQQEMAAHGLSGDAAPVSGLPSLGGANLGGGPPQSMLNNNTPDWQGIFGPSSFSARMQQQMQQGQQGQQSWQNMMQQPQNMQNMLQQAQQYMQQGQQGQQSSTLPNSIFSSLNITPWQQQPLQA